MTTVTLIEAMAAIDTAMKTHDPSLLADLVIETHDGRELPVLSATWDQLRAELDAHTAMLSTQEALLAPALALLPELQEFFGDRAPAALTLLQHMVRADWPEGSEPPTIPHPSGVGVALEPTYIAAQWEDLDQQERRAMRGRLDLEWRVGADWDQLALTYLDVIAAQVEAIDLTELDDTSRLLLALTSWDDAGDSTRTKLAQKWQEARQ